MRTKTLVAVAVLAAGVASSMAQVYSQNVVGYVNTTIPANTVGGGFAIIANPLQTTNSDISTVIPRSSVDANTTVYFWNPGSSSYTIVTATTDDNDNPVWSGPLALAPGNGFWIKNPAATAKTLTFVGEVQQGSLANAIPAGFSMKASQVPQSGDLASVLNYPAVTGSTTIYFWRSATYEIRTRTTDDNDNVVWSGPTVPLVGEGFWVKENGSLNWTRNFTVN